VRDRDRLPADQVLLGVPALGVALHEGVVEPEVPGPAEQLAVHLPLADQRLAARALDHERRRRERLRRLGRAARRRAGAALSGRARGEREAAEDKAGQDDGLEETHGQGDGDAG
jgi:hypothetical protein